MGNVISLRTHDRRSRLAVAPGAAIRIHYGQIEPSCEPTPCDLGCVEQVTDILSGHLRCSAAGAHIAVWIGIADHRESAVSVAYQLPVPPVLFETPLV